MKAVQSLQRQRTLERVRAWAVEAAEKDDVERLLLGRRHGAEIVRDDPRVKLGVDVRENLRRRCARAQEHSLSRLDHGGRRLGDALLLEGVRAHVGHVPRFFDDVLLEDGAAVGTREQAFGLQALEIPPDGHLGHAEQITQHGDANASLFGEYLQDATLPFGREHLAQVWRRHRTPHRQ